MSNDEILREFLLETHENLALLDSDLVRLEKHPTDSGTLAQVFRTLHSVKGTAGFMGLVKLQAVAHSAESLLSRLRAGELRFNAPIATALLRVVDVIRELLAKIETTGAEGDGDYSAVTAEVDRLREAASWAAVDAVDAPPPSVAEVVAPAPGQREESPTPAVDTGKTDPLLPSLPPLPPPAVASLPDPRLSSPLPLPPLPPPPTPIPPSPPLPASPPVSESPAPLTRPSAATVAFAAPLLPPIAAASPFQPAIVASSASPPAASPSTGGGAGAVHAGPNQARSTPSSSTSPSPVAGTPAGTAGENNEPRSSGVTDSSIRVDVGLLDKLMTLVGELVLARNQILQYSAEHEDDGFLGAVQRLNLLTTDLQASVMKTRMQPIGTVLGKFPRVVRDLALACGKQVRFEMDGQETELDKTLLEAIRDPLTHIVRNAVDHGIETPASRVEAGKPPEGRLRMVAFHEGGKVIIEITDDGGGINVDRVREKAVANKVIAPETASRMSRQDLLRLIFLPGFSTADRVTQFSGRGVGMDVVRTNIERIGGTVDLESTPGQGTTIRTKIPLTLAIIPALIIVSGGERYAIPQVSLLELVRLDAEQAGRGLERIHGVPVYRLRGDLLPLVFLDEQLELASTRGAASDLSIVVLQADDRPFGLVVDAIRDTEEIVVKPLQKQLKGIALFAGAAIMGDGRVALVLDVLGLAQRSGVISGGKSRFMSDDEREDAAADDDVPPALLFLSSGGEQMAIPLSQVARLEEFPRSRLESLGDRQVVQYRGAILPLIDVSSELERLRGDASVGGRRGGAGETTAARIERNAMNGIRAVPGRAEADMSDEGETSGSASSISVVVYGDGSQQVGLIVGRILDIVHQKPIGMLQGNRPGVLFTSVVEERVTEFIDAPALVREATREFAGEEVAHGG